MLLIYLRRLTLLQVSYKVSKILVSKIILKVCIDITKYLGPKYLHLPETVEEMKQKVSHFEVKFSIPQAFGATDGTHIPIHRCTENSQNFFIYKGFFYFSSGSL